MNQTAAALAVEMGVTYGDVMSFARAVVNELVKDKITPAMLQEHGPDLWLSYLQPAITTQERIQTIAHMSPAAHSTLVRHVYHLLTGN